MPIRPDGELAAAILARRREWDDNPPSTAERAAVLLLFQSAKADAEWRRLLRAGRAVPRRRSLDPHLLLRLIVWSFELASLHDEEKDIHAAMRAYGTELTAAGGLLFEFFLERSGLDRNSFWKLEKAKLPDEPHMVGSEVAGAFRMRWVLEYLSLNLLMDTMDAGGLPRPRAAYKSDGKARMFEHRLAAFLEEVCGAPCQPFVLATSEVLYPGATPLDVGTLAQKRLHERTMRRRRADQALEREALDEAERPWDFESEPDVTHHSWYGNPPDTGAIERKVRRMGRWIRLFGRIAGELRRVARQGTGRR